MSGGQWIWWSAWIAGIIFAVGMLWLARWALFGDKARGRLRCPRCWYDMTASPSLTCSECGHAASNPRQLRATRRRWGIAALAILSLTAGGLILIDRINEVGWATLMPSRVLLLAAPFDDWLGRAVLGELAVRMQRGQLSEGELASLVDRWVAGDFRARPPSDEWIARYGNLVWQWRDALSHSSDLHDRLLNLPVRIELTSRDVWPAGASPVAVLEMRRWWPSDVECRLRITSRGGDATTTTLYHGGRQGIRGRLALPLPPLTDSMSQIPFDVVVEQRLAGSGEGAWRAVESRTMTVRTRVDAAAAALEAVSTPAAEAIMRAVFNGEVTKWSDGRSPVRIRYRPWAPAASELDGAAVGVVVDLMRDGQVARRLKMWWRVADGLPPDQWQFGSELPQENLPLLLEANGDDGRWTMRVRSDLELALRVDGASRYWSGEFAVPLNVQTLPGTAPPSAWWIEEE